MFASRVALVTVVTAIILWAAPVAQLRAAGEVPVPPTDHELTMYVFPPPTKISYTSPRSLMYSFIRALMGGGRARVKHVLGHVFTRIHSGDREWLTGQTTTSQTEEMEILRELHYGLGYLGAAFVGELDQPEKLEREVADRLQTGEMAYVRFLVSPSTSGRVMQFLTEYHEKGFDSRWGEANRPRYGEGGACGSLAAAFLEIGGLLDDGLRQAWTVNFLIPRISFGGPLLGQRARLSAVLPRSLFWGRWARPDEEHIPCLLWDPGKMYEWIIATWKQEQRYRTGRYQLEKNQNCLGLVIDARTVPTPTDPFWRDPVAEPNMQGRQPGVHGGPDFDAAMERQLTEMVRRGWLRRGRAAD